MLRCGFPGFFALSRTLLFCDCKDNHSSISISCGIGNHTSSPTCRPPAITRHMQRIHAMSIRPRRLPNPQKGRREPKRIAGAEPVEPVFLAGLARSDAMFCSASRAAIARGIISSVLWLDVAIPRTSSSAFSSALEATVASLRVQGRNFY